MRQSDLNALYPGVNFALVRSLSVKGAELRDIFKPNEQVVNTFNGAFGAALNEIAQNFQ